MSHKDKKSSSGHHNHGRPVTRRDFFAQGLYSVGGSIVTPSIFSMLSSVARGEPTAAQCGGDPNKKGMMPFIVIDLAGGPNLAGTNVIVGGKGGQTDYLPASSYTSIGLSPQKAPGAAGVTPATDFGLAFHPDSKMLAGLRATADATVSAKVDGAIFCAKTADDTDTNPLNPAFWICKGAAIGELVSVVGTGDGTVGGRSTSPGADPKISVVKAINTPAAAAGLVDPGRLAQVLAALSGGNAAEGKKDAEKVLKTIQSISESSLRNFQKQSLPTQLTTLINCGYLSAAEVSKKYTPEVLDPSRDANVTSVFTMTNAQQAAGATIAKLVLDGYAAAGTISLGGYDYHGQDRATQDQKDQAVGEMIGRILKLASLKQKSVMIYVITDGGVSASGGANNNGIYAFTSDSGERSSAFALVYNAGQGRPPMRSNRRQIGAFNTAGAVDLTAAPKISGNTTTLTKALVANYLALHGKEAGLRGAVGDDPFGTTDLENYLAFAKMV